MKNNNTIIIGAGRLGGTIARSMNKISNIVVVDRNKEKIGRLGDFSGFVEVGDATDRKRISLDYGDRRLSETSGSECIDCRSTE